MADTGTGRATGSYDVDEAQAFFAGAERALAGGEATVSTGELVSYLECMSETFHAGTPSGLAMGQAAMLLRLVADGDPSVQDGIDLREGEVYLP